MSPSSLARTGGVVGRSRLFGSASGSAARVSASSSSNQRSWAAPGRRNRLRCSSPYARTRCTAAYSMFTANPMDTTDGGSPRWLASYMR